LPINNGRGNIAGSLKEIKPANWCLTESYLEYLEKPAEESEWVPDQEYYFKIISRLVDSILDAMEFSSDLFEWYYGGIIVFS